MIKPFSEYALFEMHNNADGFFASGSAGSLGNAPGTFATNLGNKEQIKASFKVSTSVAMNPNSSSIYYFNFSNRLWNIPSTAAADVVGPFQKYSIPTQNWASNYVFTSPEDQGTNGSEYIEDAKGFDYLGRPIFSGSLEIYRQELAGTNQTSKAIYSNSGPKSGKDIIPYLTENYRKSVQRSNLYKASSAEVFKPDIDRPFLLEKAVIEIPMAMGPTWFQDRTITGTGYTTGSYGGVSAQMIDQAFFLSTGGPCLTVSLMCQKNYGIETIRDLILSGTVTHQDDSYFTLYARKMERVTNTYLGTQAMHIAVESNGVKSPTFIVTKNGSSQFTGSVLIKSEASVSNGAVGLIVTENMLTGSSPGDGPSYRYFTPEGYISATIDRLTYPRISSKYASNSKVLLTALDPFGRGMTGFSPSGGSIFGGEYVTTDFDLFVQGTSIVNPTYISDSTIREKVINQISSTIAAEMDIIGLPYPDSALAYIYDYYETPVFSGNKSSPYLLNPGDDLVLTISKTRPAISMSYNDVPDETSAQYGISNAKYSKMLTGSISGHDVCLLTGTINITLYGSYVREGNNYVP